MDEMHACMCSKGLCWLKGGRGEEFGELQGRSRSPSGGKIEEWHEYNAPTTWTRIQKVFT